MVVLIVSGGVVIYGIRSVIIEIKGLVFVVLFFGWF